MQVKYAAEAWIIDHLEHGNEWAWCVVIVTASVELDGEHFRGQDALGCSYASQEDFERGGYFEDMKARALEDLERTLEATRDRGIAASIIRKHLQEQ